MLKIDGGASTQKPLTPSTGAASNPVVVNQGGTDDRAHKVGTHEFTGAMIQFRVRAQQANPPTIDDEIKRLRGLMRNLPPEDQQAIQQEIKGLELTKMASDPARVNRTADEIINRHGGRDHFDYEAAGKELAEIAKLSPQAGKAVMDSILGKIKEDDRDEIAQSFTESLTDAELSKLAKDPAGKALLETVKSRLLEGKVHDDEKRTGERLDMALKSATNTVDQQIEASAQRVREAWDNYDSDGAASTLASEIDRLNALYGPDAGGKLIAKMFKDDPEEFTNMLRFAGNLPPSQQSTIGIAMGQAFDKMSPEDKQSFARLIARTTVADAFSAHLDGKQPTRLAELVAKSFSSDFKRAVVGEMMKEAEKIKPGPFGDNGGVDVKALFNSAAIIAESAPKNLQVELFGTIVKTLPKVNLPSLTSDPQLKDRLSKLFIDNGSDIIRANAPDGAYVDEQFMNGMVKFFELTLFSKNGGNLRQDLMKSVITTLQDVGDAVKDNPPLSQSAYERAHGGYSQQDHVEAMGGLAAFVWKAAQNQKDTIQKDQKAREETAKLFIGMAFAFVPGSKDVIGEVALEGGDFLGKLADKAINYTWEKGKGMLESNAQNLVNNQLRALNDGDALNSIDKILDAMRGTMVTINAAMPNGEEGELDLRSKFQAAFAFYNLLLQK